MSNPKISNPLYIGGKYKSSQHLADEEDIIEVTLHHTQQLYA